MGLEWSLELTPSKSFFCMKMLRWSFAYSVMVSDNSHLNWSSWFTTRNRLVSGVEDLVLRRSLDFLKLCSFFLFLLRCSSLLLKPDEEESRKEVELIPLLYFFSCVIFSPNIYISFSNAFAPVSYFLKDLHCHLHYLRSYFNPDLRKKLLQRFSQIRQLLPLHVWITKQDEDP